MPFTVKVPIIGGSMFRHAAVPVAIISLMTPASGQTKEAFACLETAKTGFDLKDGKYATVRFVEDKFIIVKDGLALTMRRGKDQETYQCKLHNSVDFILDCTGKIYHLALNTKKMVFVHSKMFGPIVGVGDTLVIGEAISISHGTCERF